MTWGVLVGVAVFVGTQQVWFAIPAAAFAYLAHVWLFPFAKCRYCGSRGGPRRTDSSGRFWHDCPVCGGSGKRRRPFSHLIGGFNV
jgi:hypothetical protein